MNWNGIENGRLLALASDNGFDALITKDSGIEYEHDLTKLPCSVVILEAESNSLKYIRPLVPSLLNALRTLPRCVVVRVRQP